MKRGYFSCSIFLLLCACGNPGGITDAEYAAYKDLGAPKILYSCTENDQILEGATAAMSRCLELPDPQSTNSCIKKVRSEFMDKPIVKVGYTAGIGPGATYNKILLDAKTACPGEFKLLDGKS